MPATRNALNFLQPESREGDSAELTRPAAKFPECNPPCFEGELSSRGRLLSARGKTVNASTVVFRRRPQFDLGQYISILSCTNQDVHRIFSSPAGAARTGWEPLPAGAREDLPNTGTPVTRGRPLRYYGRVLVPSHDLGEPAAADRRHRTPSNRS